MAPGVVAQDLDLGTAGPTVFDLPGSTPPGLVFIGGKEGIVYLMDRSGLCCLTDAGAV